MTLSTQKIQSEDFVFGGAGAAISLTGGYATLKTSEYFLEKWGIKVTESQIFFRLYDRLQTVGNAFLRGALKSLAIFYVIVLVPVIEEWVFRDLIYEWQKENAASKMYRIISNGILFGAFHFSVFYGWANIPIVAVASVAGIVFAALREMRDNRYAATIAHSINNSFVLLLNFLKF